MNIKSCQSRRAFLSAVAATWAALSVGRAGAEPTPETKPSPKIIGFSKPFKQATPKETADIVAEIGWDGIECPVRANGQIEPERVEQDLPRMVDALRKVGCDVTIITTDIKGVNPLTEKVLRTAVALGIKRYRLGFWRYNESKSIPEQIAEVRNAMRELATLNKTLGLTGGYQNHSGATMFGAGVWDIYEAIKECDPKQMGICFDIGHATIEGGLSWPITARLMRPFYEAVFVKDFAWQKGPKAWVPMWCPLGEGTIDPRFFRTLKESDYDGPICQHHEYPVGEGAEMIKAMKKDLAVLKKWLAD
jgi:sugar phosphate isomerase/epimerase